MQAWLRGVVAAAFLVVVVVALINGIQRTLVTYNGQGAIVHYDAVPSSFAKVSGMTHHDALVVVIVWMNGVSSRRRMIAVGGGHV